MHPLHHSLSIRRLDMSTTTIKVQGMTCNHCVMRVAKALKAVPGVQDAQVDLGKAQAVITYADTQVTPEKLSAAIVEAGYKAG
jgi:copper ion binding protein